jgi:hypothetical protein
MKLRTVAWRVGASPPILFRSNVVPGEMALNKSCRVAGNPSVTADRRPASYSRTIPDMSRESHLRLATDRPTETPHKQTSGPHRFAHIHGSGITRPRDYVIALSRVTYWVLPVRQREGQGIITSRQSVGRENDPSPIGVCFHILPGLGIGGPCFPWFGIDAVETKLRKRIPRNALPCQR